MHIAKMPNPLLARITSDPAIFGGKPIIHEQLFAVEHLRATYEKLSATPFSLARRRRWPQAG